MGLAKLERQAKDYLLVITHMLLRLSAQHLPIMKEGYTVDGPKDTAYAFLSAAYDAAFLF